MDMISKILEEYSTRMLNERAVPEWLLKQVNGVWMAAEDFDKGVQMIIDGLQDERDWIDNRLETI